MFHVEIYRSGRLLGYLTGFTRDEAIIFVRNFNERGGLRTAVLSY